jgi:hypothetical protein
LLHFDLTCLGKKVFFFKILVNGEHNVEFKKAPKLFFLGGGVFNLLRRHLLGRALLSGLFGLREPTILPLDICADLFTAMMRLLAAFEGLDLFQILKGGLVALGCLAQTLLLVDV